MELQLQLGLALPTHNPTTNGFDLNKNGFEMKEMAAWRNEECCLDNKINGNKKRSFAVAFEDGGARNEFFSLLSWSAQPNEDDDGRGDEKGTSITSDKNEEDSVVGWPPIKSWRKKLLHPHHHHHHLGGRIVKDQTVERRSLASNSTYVKVKMEGVPIGRKINLRLYDSYQTLTNTLISMFAKYQKCEKNNNAGYKLTYRDKDGDWLLAGDVPWQTFMESVSRLEILRNAG